MKRRAHLILAITLAAVGCSSTTTSPGDPNAQSSGAPPAPTDSVAMPPPADAMAPPPAQPPPSQSDAGAGSPFAIVDQIVVVTGVGYGFKLTSYAGACTLEQQGNSSKQNSHYWKLNFRGPTTSQLPTGTYPLNTTVGGYRMDVVGVHDRGATCKEIDHDATSASVTIATSTTATVAGTIDAVIPDLGTFHVPFSAAGCATLSGGAKACVP
jgi:hypothetical protein